MREGHMGDRLLPQLFGQEVAARLYAATVSSLRVKRVQGERKLLVRVGEGGLKARRLVDGGCGLSGRTDGDLVEVLHMVAHGVRTLSDCARALDYAGVVVHEDCASRLGSFRYMCDASVRMLGDCLHALDKGGAIVWERCWRSRRG